MVQVVNLSGINITPLKQIKHSKGDIFHALKASEPCFSEFGEAYFTTVHAGVTKGWKKHTRMRMNLIVPVGEVIFFIYSEDKCRTESITIGCNNYARLTIEPGLWVAFRGGDHSLNLVLNIASLKHNPSESVNVELNKFPLA